jgi:rod shape-determining protein MreC
LFLLLETLSFYLIFKNNRFQNTGFINSANVVSANVLSLYSEIREYFYLRKTNQILVEENALLRSLLKQSFIEKQIPYKSDTNYLQKYVYRTAKVLNNSVNKRNNFLTLDKGRLHGIEPEMGVISPDGVVGVVKDVSENFSSVMSVLNKNTVVSCKVKKNGYLGTLVWEGGDYSYGTLNDVPRHAALEKGDTIITSGASAIYPEGILVGFVDSINLEDGDNFYTVRIRFSTDYAKLTYVYVVKNLMKDEQVKLEKATQNDN